MKTLWAWLPAVGYGNHTRLSSVAQGVPAASTERRRARDMRSGPKALLLWRHLWVAGKRRAAYYKPGGAPALMADFSKLASGPAV